jgi:hypothetical protein
MMARHVHIHVHTRDDATFEGQHPRGEGGKFGEGSHGSAAPEEPAPAAKKAKKAAVDPAQHKADAHAQTLPILRKAMEGREVPIPEDVLLAAAEYLHGRKSVDLLKMEEAVPGLSIGAMKKMREAQLEHFRSQQGGAPQTQAQRIGSYLKQKHIGPIRR